MRHNMPELVEVDANELKKWGDTRAALVWQAPAFTHLLFTMMNRNENEHIAYFVKDEPKGHPHHIPVAATDGAHVLINPVHFFKYDLAERVFVTCHEVVHGMCGHPELMQRLANLGKVKYPDGKELPFDADTLNWAMDYVVNDLLVESKIGKYNQDWLWDTNIGKHDDDVLVVYRRILPKDMGGQGQSGGPLTSGGNGQPSQKNGKGQQPFDQHMKPGTTTGQDATQAANNRNEQEWKTATAGAMAAAQAQGKLPAALQRYMEQEIEPVVDWRDLVHGFFARKVGGGGYDWRKADRRLIVRGIYGPARSGHGCGDIVVAGDSSGSITDAITSLWCGELGGILEDLKPRRIVFMWCDAAVHSVDELFDSTDLYDIRKRGGLGGGGTDFRPVFDKIKELGLEPDALVYLTDGDGSFPKQAPAYPVLWGDISNNPKKYPFGDVVNVPIP